MSQQTIGMLAAALIALLAGLLLVRPRFAAATGPGKLFALGPVFEAVALALFAAEHFLAARDLVGIVPRWLPAPLFWTYFFGVTLLAAAISFIVWKQVSLAASLLALFFFLIVLTIDLPALPKGMHDRIFWILTVRETCFGAGALVLGGSRWLRDRATGARLTRLGRLLVACTLVFYAIEHFLHPHNVPGVPLEKMIPASMPAPVLLSCFVGATLLAAGIGLTIPRTRGVAAAGGGTVLLLLTALFYTPILASEIRTPLAMEGLNYVGDTLLFASTVLLAGLPGTDPNEHGEALTHQNGLA